MDLTEIEDKAEFAFIDGPIVGLRSGSATSKILNIDADGSKRSWPRVFNNQHQLYVIKDGKAVPFHIVSREIPEMPIPVGMLRALMLEERNRLRRECGSFDQATGAFKLDEIKFAKGVAKWGLAQMQIEALRAAYTADMTPEGTGQVAANTWFAALLSRVKEDFTLLVTAAGGALVYGIQVGPLIVPDGWTSSWWFNLLPPAVLLIGVGIHAWRRSR